MDDPRHPRAAASLPLQLRPQDGSEPLPAGFTPIGLMLLPSGMRVELTKQSTLVGRHSSADVRLPLPDVSRQHCRFVFAQGAWYVVDLDSTNGIFVNNQRVQRAPIRAGDRVRIGGFVLEVAAGASGHLTAELTAADVMPVLPVKKEQRRAS